MVYKLLFYSCVCTFVKLHAMYMQYIKLGQIYVYIGMRIHILLCKENNFHLFVFLGGVSDLDAAVWKVRTSDAREEGIRPY